MYTLGIDVAKRRHHATLLDDSGATVFGNYEVLHSRKGFEQLLTKLATVAPADAIRVGMEATGHYWMVLFEALTQAGYTVDVINPLVISARQTSRSGAARPTAWILCSSPWCCGKRS